MTFYIASAIDVGILPDGFASSKNSKGEPTMRSGVRPAGPKRLAGSSTPPPCGGVRGTHHIDKNIDNIIE